jgi:hypothetical protein
VALQHNLGFGRAVVVTVYKRADNAKNAKVDDDEIRKSNYFAYNPATEARYVTKEDGDKVRSKTVRSEYALGDTLEKIQSRLQASMQLNARTHVPHVLFDSVSRRRPPKGLAMIRDRSGQRTTHQCR